MESKVYYDLNYKEMIIEVFLFKLTADLTAPPSMICIHALCSSIIDKFKNRYWK